MKIKRFAALFCVLLCIPAAAQAKESDSATAVIGVSSEAENIEETFTCVLEDENGKELNRTQVKAGEEGSFAIQTTEPGVESYKVWQAPGTDKDAVYDKTVYCVDVYTVIENDAIKSEPVIYVKGTDSKLDKCRFSNKKAAPVAEKPKEPEKEKTVWENITEIIKTGEESNLGLWIAFALVSGTGILLALFGKKKRKE